MKGLMLISVLLMSGCASFAPPATDNPMPSVVGSYVVMQPNHPALYVLKTNEGWISMGAGDVLTCKELEKVTVCQVFGSPL